MVDENGSGTVVLDESLEAVAYRIDDTPVAYQGGGGGGPPGGGGGGPSCDGNIVGSVVVEDAEAVGNGKLTYDSAIDIEITFDATNDITFLHVSENRIEVREA